jgi:mannose-6-phosphate isomerase-like protein (cupin superfamily)
MSKDWRTKELSAIPDRGSPSGAAEIQVLGEFSEGEIAHATVLANRPSDAGILTGFGEFFYILEGEGDLWRATGALQGVVPLFPGRCVSIPPGIEYQYRARRIPMKFLVATAPRFQLENWRKVERHYWEEHRTEDSTPPPQESGPWMTKDLPKNYDYLAPDGSEIRLLPAFDAGGLAHCKLPAGTISGPVRHRTVKEVWYVLGGRGQVWRSNGVEDEVVNVASGTCLTIPTGVSFQFRALKGGPLEIMIGTFPAWPGPGEAEPVSGHWRVTWWRRLWWRVRS